MHIRQAPINPRIQDIHKANETHMQSGEHPESRHEVRALELEISIGLASWHEAGELITGL